MKIIPQKVELIHMTPTAEKFIELAGRTCYKSESLINDNSAAKFSQKIYNSGHHAIIEFGSAHFKFTTNRAITHEIVRHRLASYAQESTRYCNYSSSKFGKECTFVVSACLKGHILEMVKLALKTVEEDYFTLLDLGVKPEIARDVLPNALKAELHMKANFREWLHFINLRSSNEAHPMIRELAEQVRDTLICCSPDIFGYIYKKERG